MGRPVTVLPDAQSGLELVTQSGQHTGFPMTVNIVDSAFRDGRTRLPCADAGGTLIDKVFKQAVRAQFCKEDYQFDLKAEPVPVGRLGYARRAAVAPSPRRGASL